METEIELLNRFARPKSENQGWHLSKLITDGERLKNDCYFCDQPGLGPTYKCERADCQLLFHKSCAEKPLPPRITHALRYGHHIIFIEELDNQERVICSFCEELVSGSAYKCLFPNCSFLIHQSCINIPVNLSKHPIDQRHNLYLRGALKEQHCDLCGKLCGMGYICVCCDVAIHIKCASRGIMSVEKCHPHEFIVFPKGECQHTCQACGQQSSEVFYLCRNCRLWIHQNCFKTYPHSIKIKECSHSLSYTISRPDEHMCKLCKELVDKRYAAYICKGFVYFCQGLPWTMDIQCSLLQRHLKHEAHQHLLSFDYSEERNCSACNKEMFFYFRCTPCDFDLCWRCATYPLQISHGDHECFLNLTYKIEDDFEEYYCLICEGKRDISY